MGATRPVTHESPWFRVHTYSSPGVPDSVEGQVSPVVRRSVYGSLVGATCAPVTPGGQE